MKKTILFCLAVCTIIFSCKKAKDTTITNNGSTTLSATQVIPAADYAMLKKGNYWIYAVYHVDTSGNGNFQYNDSIYVSKDTLIHNDTFHVVEGDRMMSSPSYYRDSADYIVDRFGNKSFSSDNFTDTLYKAARKSFGITELLISVKMSEKDKQIILPAGTFIASSCRETITEYPDMPKHQAPYFYDTWYVKKIGKVKYSISESTGPGYYFEYRLLRYHVQ